MGPFFVDIGRASPSPATVDILFALLDSQKKTGPSPLPVDRKLDIAANVEVRR